MRLSLRKVFDGGADFRFMAIQPGIPRGGGVVGQPHKSQTRYPFRAGSTLAEPTVSRNFSIPNQTTSDTRTRITILTDKRSEV